MQMQLLINFNLDSYTHIRPRESLKLILEIILHFLLTRVFVHAGRAYT
jgi:hypothetical protein